MKIEYIRVLSVTPRDCSYNEILQSVIPDLIKASTYGIMVLDAFRNTVQVFLDIGELMDDTPAVNSALKLRGRTAASFFHL